jgi:hypothetical protein
MCGVLVLTRDTSNAFVIPFSGDDYIGLSDGTSTRHSLQNLGREMLV